MGLSIVQRLEVPVWRLLARLGSYLDRRVSKTAPAEHSFSISIPVANPPGSIKLYFWTPPSYTRPSPSSSSPPSKRYPVLVNFHGGGYTIGHAVDDARFCALAAASLDVVAVSVDYRLAPENRFPTGIHDGATAVRYLWAHADELALDARRTLVSGFSAGGNFSLTVPMRLVQEPKSNGAARAAGRLVGTCSFYPATDRRTTLAEKRARQPDGAGIPRRLMGIFDSAYLTPEAAADRAQPLLSPGAASDGLLCAALPRRMALFTAERDVLRPEAEALRERLRGLGKFVGGRMVEGAIHAWDKRYPLRGTDERTDRAYEDAMEEMRVMLREA